MGAIAGFFFLNGTIAGCCSPLFLPLRLIRSHRRVSRPHRNVPDNHCSPGPGWFKLLWNGLKKYIKREDAACLPSVRLGSQNVHYLTQNKRSRFTSPICFSKKHIKIVID
jgi:hypothetical protein